jgi:hypothetical protein
MKRFTFLVITFNHEEYILEHLESIKYLIDNYGEHIDVSIVISDDASRDDTVALCQFWLDKNRGLFDNVEMLTRKINVGVCESVLDLVNLINTKYFKLTAGDDIYSCENLFRDFELIKDFEIVSGIPLNLVDGVVYKSKFNVFNIFATKEIYSGSDYIEKLKRISFSFAPAMVYSYDAISNDEIKRFLGEFSVIEDFPLHIKMAEVFRPLRFFQSSLVYVYYRRTPGSIYLVRGGEYDKDKLKAFNYLFENDKGYVGRLLLANRMYCYRSNNRFKKTFLNLSYYLYAFNIIINLWRILPAYFRFNTCLSKHQAHYNFIRTQASKVEI